MSTLFYCCTIKIFFKKYLKNIFLTIFMFYIFCCLFYFISYFLHPFVGYLHAECQSFSHFLGSSCLLDPQLSLSHSDYTFMNPNNCALCWLESQPSGDRLLHRCARSLSVALPDVWETDSAESGNESDYFFQEKHLRFHHHFHHQIFICSLFIILRVWSDAWFPFL